MSFGGYGEFSSILYYVPNTQSSLAVITATGKSAATYMQDFTKSMCQSQASSGSVPVTDARDNNTYDVRYISNNCWMVQNLRYVGDTGSTSTSMIMKSATSNISTDQNLTIGDLTLGNDYNNARIHNSGNTTNGVWYNYAAASAGYVTSNKNSTVESTESVCPKNWRLPTYSEMSVITSYQSAFFNGGSAVTGGYYYGGTVSNTGRGFWWSSTPYSSDRNYRYYLVYNGSSLNTNFNNRDFGHYVRCVRDADTMQSITADTISSMSDGDTVELKDTRDNNVYTTRKINGKLWMVQNLRYVGDTVGSTSTSTTWYLKSATSNVSADKTMTMTDLTSGNTYDAARFHNSGNTTTGVWYNYAAASAMTITGSPNTTAASQDICPKNWRLPTNSEQSGITSYSSQYSPVTGGYYLNGSLGVTGSGYWWSATSSSSTSRYLLYYNGSSLGTSSLSRGNGFYVRCVHN